MSVLNIASVSALVGLTVLRLGLPLLTIWLLGAGIKRAFPAQL